ncbi:sulfotransferase 1 family member D1-like [Patiria miniata]|uniref:Sulfotransferase domain-containing protein n=1 Tax=Patiria miniata TaxID=46514 RepID=A0A914ANB3_PATMI|nr:sulfotransferase 1 family member D1-like [Patiria miniata]
MLNCVASDGCKQTHPYAPSRQQPHTHIVVTQLGLYGLFSIDKKLLASKSSKFVYVEHEGITLYWEGDDVVKALKTFEVRDDDSWIVTFPKTGTTWVQEIMSCVMHDGNLEEVNKRHTVFRVPFLEFNLPKTVRDEHKLPQSYKLIETVPSPRVIKSHLPGQLLPPKIWDKAKLVYVIRNPKDVVVSNFYFLRKINPERSGQTFSEFFDEMMAGKDPYGPWWDHYLFFWKKRHHPNILLLRFEDLKRDLRGNVETISKFLGKDLPAEALDAITDHCTFANMKKNPMANPDSLYGNPEPAPGATQAPFMRKGKVGDWKSHFTVAQSEAMDALIRDKFYGTGLTFDQ